MQGFPAYLPLFRQDVGKPPGNTPYFVIKLQKTTVCSGKISVRLLLFP